MNLSASETRVLGCMLEKQLTTPGHLSAHAQQPAPGVQPVDQPRPGGGIRRRDPARRAAPPRAPRLHAAGKRPRSRPEVPAPARGGAADGRRRAGGDVGADAAWPADPGRAQAAGRAHALLRRARRGPRDARPPDRARARRMSGAPARAEGGPLRAAARGREAQGTPTARRARCHRPATRLRRPSSPWSLRSTAWRSASPTWSAKLPRSRGRRSWRAASTRGAPAEPSKTPETIPTTRTERAHEPASRAWS